MSFPVPPRDTDTDTEICAAPDVSRLGLVEVYQARPDRLVRGHDVEGSLGSDRPRALSCPSP